MFPAHMIVPWIAHRTADRACRSCGLKNVPGMVVKADGTVYEKQGRFHLQTPEKFFRCEDR